MSQISRKLVLLLTVAHGLCVLADASSTATIVVGGTAPPSDASTITISFNGFVETVRYGPYSTPASVASAFAAMFSRDYLQQNLCANASGTVITFKLRGDSTFGVLDITGSTISFPLTSSGFASSTTQLQDTGTVSLVINGSAIATTDYGLNSTPNTIAAALAESVPQNSPVNVTAYDNTLHIDAVATGTGTDSISYSVNIVSTNPAFTSPSFSASGGGDLSGATAGGTDTATQVYSYSAVYDGVGNLSSNADSVMGTWVFSPDTLNRLLTAQNTATTGTSSQYANNYGCWNYDQFGNRLSQSMSTTPCGNGPPQTSWAHYNGTGNGSNNNQMSATSQNALQGTASQFGTGGSGYDASGNVTNDGVNQYLYDAEGRICAVASTPVQGMTTMTGYLYDAEGTRVAKGVISAWSCDPATSGFATTTDYVLGPSGEQVTEMAVSGTTLTWAHTNIWAGGKLLGTYDLTAKGLHFYLDDMLGTRRVQTDYLGVVEQSCVSLPFGDDLTCSGSTETPTEHHFTGKERDTESGNDYFGARYYASSMGRWMSPDWSAKVEPVPYSKLDDPQSLNLYAYVMNNPMTRMDADGHMGSAAEATAQATEDWVNGYTPVRFDPPKAQQQVTAKVKGQSVTYTYPDGSKVVLKGTHPYRDNNPGDLDRGGYGAIGTDRTGKHKFSIYPSLSDGLNALAQTLTNKYGNSSIADTMSHFASDTKHGDNPAQYAADLAASIGVPVSTRISSLSPAQLTTVEFNIAGAEGYNDAHNTASYSAPPQ